PASGSMSSPTYEASFSRLHKNLDRLKKYTNVANHAVCVNADFILTHHRWFRTDPPGDFLLVRW
ncbi:hypothetical protein ACEF06_26155, partial [Brevibacillus agri]